MTSVSRSTSGPALAARSDAGRLRQFSPRPIRPGGVMAHRTSQPPGLRPNAGRFSTSLVGSRPLGSFLFPARTRQPDRPREPVTDGPDSRQWPQSLRSSEPRAPDGYWKHNATKGCASGSLIVRHWRPPSVPTRPAVRRPYSPKSSWHLPIQAPPLCAHWRH